jgi:hypothetical protein
MVEHLNAEQLMETLSVCLGKLEGGSLSIGEFSTWFTNARWESAMAANSDALHLGWDIQNILFEYQDFPDLIPSQQVIAALKAQLDSYESLPAAHSRSISAAD